MLETRLREASNGFADAVVNFCQRLIRTPSPPGEEGRIAALVAGEMRRLGYDAVETDAAGNVIGQIRGSGGRSLMLNTHLDHVDVGDPERWASPPFDGAIVDGAIWGRGAMDIKGPLACQVYAPAVLRAAGIVPPGDLYVTATVMEEVGGIGAQLLARELAPDLAVVGEASRCQVARGHRGRVEIEVRFTGRGGHASMPRELANPHYTAARLLAAVEGLEMVDSDGLGPATVSPTLYRSDQSSRNVTPEQVLLVLDWRTVPDEGPEQVLGRVARLAEAACGEGISVEVGIPQTAWRTYTGLAHPMPAIFPAFELPETQVLVQAAREALETIYNEAVPVRVWRFATDGGHFMAAGIPTVGFGPGDDRLAHTTEERIGLVELARGLLGNAALCARLGEVAI